MEACQEEAEELWLYSRLLTAIGAGAFGLSSCVNGGGGGMYWLNWNEFSFTFFFK